MVVVALLKLLVGLEKFLLFRASQLTFRFSLSVMINYNLV